jgi:inosine/xanthosine triphosphate pyrophosphatase family protein
MYIDISLSDLEYSTSTENINKLAELFVSIPTMPFQVRSLEIIKETLVEEDKEEVFNTFMSFVLQKTKEMASVLRDETEKVKSNSDPIISPTDLVP